MILPKEINTAELTGKDLKKYRRKMRILDLLYHHDSLTGTEISRRIRVSLPTSLALLSELSDLQFVEERGSGVSRGGRKPSLYGLSSRSIYVFSCEIGRYRGKIGLFNVVNEQVGALIFFQTSIDDDQLVDKIYAHACELVEKNGIERDRILALGVSMPGLIDETRGINYTIKNTPYRNVKGRLEARFDQMVYINNDARMQACGEYVFGAAKGHKDALVVAWSWGVGLGIIMDGKLYNGANGFAAELSHIKVMEDGDLCICGKRGCLETVTSANVLVNRAQQWIRDKKVSQLTEKFSDRPDELTPEDVIKAAKSGDEFSIHLLHEVGLALGKGLSITIQLINPEIIVLGGPVSTAKQFVLTPIQQSLNKYCLEDIVSNTKLVISESWEKSGLLGITATLFQMIFGEWHIFNFKYQI